MDNNVSITSRNISSSIYHRMNVCRTTHIINDLDFSRVSTSAAKSRKEQYRLFDYRIFDVNTEDMIERSDLFTNQIYKKLIFKIPTRSNRIGIVYIGKDDAVCIREYVKSHDIRSNKFSYKYKLIEPQKRNRSTDTLKFQFRKIEGEKDFQIKR